MKNKLELDDVWNFRRLFVFLNDNIWASKFTSNGNTGVLSFARRPNVDLNFVVFKQLQQSCFIRIRRRDDKFKNVNARPCIAF